MAVGFHPLLAAITAGGWTAAQAGAARGELAFALSGYAIAQICLFGLVALVTSLAPVRRAPRAFVVTA